MSKDFDFDKFAGSASFNEIRGLMFEKRRLPSMSSPDGAWLYLSSLDVIVSSTNEDDMRFMLKCIVDELASTEGGIQRPASSLNDYRIDRTELEARLEYF